MAGDLKTLIAAAGLSTIPATTAARYLPVAGPLYAGFTPSVNLERMARWIPADGAVGRFIVNVRTNTTPGAMTWTLMKNEAPTSAQIVVPAGGVGAFQTDQEVAVAEGDRLAWQCVRASSSGVVTIVSVQADYACADGKARTIHVIVSGSTAVENNVRFSQLSGFTRTAINNWDNSISNLARARSKNAMGAPGRFTHVFLNASSNLASDTIYTLVVNDVDAQSFVYPMDHVGPLTFTANVVVNAGDEVHWKRHRPTAGGVTGTLGHELVEAAFVSDSGAWDIFSTVGHNRDPANLARAQVNRFAPAGALSNTLSGDIHESSLSLPQGGAVSDFRGVGYTAANGAEWFGWVEVDGVNSGLSVSFPGGSGDAGPPPVSTGSYEFAAGAQIAFAYEPTDGGSLPDYRSFYYASATITPGGGPTPPEVSPPPGMLRVEGFPPVIASGASASPEAGSAAFFGGVPQLVEFSGATPKPGALQVAGLTPDLAFDAAIDAVLGALEISGSSPRLLDGVVVSTEGSVLRVSGGQPIITFASGSFASQAALLARGRSQQVRSPVSQLATMVLAEPPPPPTRSSQAAALVLGEIVPVVAASQTAILALGHGSACISYRCQLWTIRRRDGQVFRYTSHDQPVHRGPHTYSPCRSLDPTASENSATLGSVGNIELTGIIDDAGISEADLYGGLFDDAFVTVDLYSWGDQAEAPRRLAAGWTGTVSQGDTAFQMEVLGPGARLDQQALVQMVTPACRWVFGDSRCTVDVEAMRLAGTVVQARTRGHLFVALPAPPPGRQWASGRIRFLTGPNAGQVVETKSVDFGLGEVVTWVSPGFLALPGDEIELMPGCDLSRDGGCTLYANVINFGGFPDVPGSDALLETPYAKY